MADRRRWRVVAAAAAIVLATGVGWDAVQVAETNGSFCSASGRGGSASAAIDAYVHRCGSDYRLAAGGEPTPFGRHSLEYTVNVADNSEGSVGWMVVTRDGAGGWRTSGPLGTGP